MSRSLNKNKNIKMSFKPLRKKDPRTIVESMDFEELVFRNSSFSVFVYSPTTINVLYDPLTGELCHKII
jgi:hypothetical protein